MKFSFKRPNSNIRIINAFDYSRVLLSSPLENIHSMYIFMSSAEISIKITPLKKIWYQKKVYQHTRVRISDRGTDYATYKAYHLFFSSSRISHTNTLPRHPLLALHLLGCQICTKYCSVERCIHTQKWMKVAVWGMLKDESRDRRVYINMAKLNTKGGKPLLGNRALTKSWEKFPVKRFEASLASNIIRHFTTIPWFIMETRM